MRKCKQCGKEIDNDEMKFCPSCGMPFQSEETIVNYTSEQLKKMSLDDLLKIEKTTNDSLVFDAIAKNYYQNDDFEKSWEYYNKAAHSDEPAIHSVYMLGLLFKEGIGCNQDYKEALKCFNFLYDEGSIDVTTELAECYLFGNGSVKDEKKAYELLETAYKSNTDDGEVFRLLGLCKFNGLGTLKNTQEAYKLFEESGKKGSDDGIFWSALCDLNGQGTKKNKNKAFNKLNSLFEKYKDDAGAEVFKFLGNCYEFGWGCSKDIKKAFEVYEKGYNIDDPYCTYRLGCFYYTGKACEKDKEYAEKLIQKAADNGDEYAIEWIKRPEIRRFSTNFLYTYINVLTLGIPHFIRKKVFL